MRRNQIVRNTWRTASARLLFLCARQFAEPASKSVPAPGLAVGGTGTLLLLGGASLLLGYHPTIGATLLVICLLGFSFRIHNYWAIQDPQAKQAEQVNFMKNMALLGLLLMTLMIPRPWPISLGR